METSTWPTIDLSVPVFVPMSDSPFDAISIYIYINLSIYLHLYISIYIYIHYVISILYFYLYTYICIVGKHSPLYPSKSRASPGPRLDVALEHTGLNGRAHGDGFIGVHRLGRLLWTTTGTQGAPQSLMAKKAEKDHGFMMVE